MFRYVTALLVATLTLAFLSYSTPPAWAATEDWPQLGEDVIGTITSTDAGESVAISNDGSIIAVGSWESTVPGNGSVRIYELIAGGWVLKGSPLTGAAANDRFGNGLALSADGLTVAIGAPVNGSSRGQVTVFSWNGSSWVAKGSALIGSATNTQFGYAVSLSADGDTLAVGAPNETSSTGKVYVYEWDASTTAWSTPVTIAGAEVAETFGRALDLNSDGSVLVVGARGNDDGGSNSGETRVYALAGGAATPRGVDIAGEAAGDLSGHAVSISGDGTVLAIGAPENDGGGADSGHVRTFEWGGVSWTQRGGDIEGDAAGDEFGYAVDLSTDGLTLIAGSPKRTALLGAIRMLTYSSNTWGELLSIVGETAAEEFGSSVALSGDATTFMGGAPSADTVTTDSGLARVFRLRVSSESSSTQSTGTPGTPGIYLHVAGPVGRHGAGSPVYYGSDRVALTSTYLLSITRLDTAASHRVLASGVVDARGNLEARALLPDLEPGAYDVVFEGKHRGGAGLRLSARLVVGPTGLIELLGENRPQLW